MARKKPKSPDRRKTPSRTPARARTPSRAPARPRKKSALESPAANPPLTATQTAAMRQLFWENVMREILNSLSMVAVLRPSEPESPAGGSDIPILDAETDSSSLPTPHQAALEHAAHDGHPHFQPELFDGRLAIILKNGERVAIGDVFPVFACSIAEDINRPLAMAVECSVFQVRTPEGQVFTIPLSEIRAFHALTPDLMRRLMDAARQQNVRSDHVPEHIPFGFAAYTSLASGNEIEIPEAPAEPGE